MTSQEWERDGRRNLRSLHMQRMFAVCAGGHTSVPDPVSDTATVLCCSGICACCDAPLLLPRVFRPSQSIMRTSLHVALRLERSEVYLPLFPDGPWEVDSAPHRPGRADVFDVSAPDADSSMLLGTARFRGAKPHPMHPKPVVGSRIALRFADFAADIRALPSDFDVTLSVSPITADVPAAPPPVPRVHARLGSMARFSADWHAMRQQSGGAPPTVESLRLSDVLFHLHSVSARCVVTVHWLPLRCPALELTTSVALRVNIVGACGGSEDKVGHVVTFRSNYDIRFGSVQCELTTSQMRVVVDSLQRFVHGWQRVDSVLIAPHVRLAARVASLCTSMAHTTRCVVLRGGACRREL